MRVGITGANGFIGNHLVRYAIGVGCRPIAFVQRDTPLDAIRDLDGKYELAHGDLLDRGSVDAFVRRCDAVIHLAGINRFWAPDREVFWRVNVVGAHDLAEACLRAGVQRLVHVSSCVTLGASDTPIPRDETSDYNLSHAFRYGETKRAAEANMKRLARIRGLPVVIVHPASAIGERDHGPTPIGQPIAAIANGWWPVYVDGGACFIDVHDVARGLWLALERGRIGEQYLLAGDNLSNRAFMTLVADCAGVARPLIRVPKPLLGPIALAAELTADYVTNTHPPLTRGMQGLIGKFLYFSGAKAERELAFSAGSCRPAIERSIEWFRRARAEQASRR